MGFFLFLLALAGVGQTHAQVSPSLEAHTSAFDFDHYRKLPIQARQGSAGWVSRDNQELQRELISGEKGRKQEITSQVAALLPEPETIPIRREPEALPSPRELTDEITTEKHGTTTKGQLDLLARGRVDNRLELASMSESDYELLVAKIRGESEEESPTPREDLLRPMPTLINSKTGGPPHGYAVSQAGLGARTEPRNNQNPFEDIIRTLRLDQPVTRGDDPLSKPPSPTPAMAIPAVTSQPTQAPVEDSGREQPSEASP